MTYFGDSWMIIFQKNPRVITFPGTLFRVFLSLEGFTSLVENHSFRLRLLFRCYNYCEILVLYHPVNSRRLECLQLKDETTFNARMRPE